MQAQELNCCCKGKNTGQGPARKAPGEQRRPLGSPGSTLAALGGWQDCVAPASQGTQGSFCSFSFMICTPI